jgi:hypothetical protein
MPTTQEKLDQAIAARHALLIGSKVVSVGYGERKIDYTPARLADLESYIAELRRELAGKPAARSRNRIRYAVPD